MTSVNILAAVAAAAVVGLTGSEVATDPCPTATQTLTRNATISDSLTGGPDVFRVDAQEGDQIVLSQAGQPQAGQYQQEGEEQERGSVVAEASAGLKLTILKQEDADQGDIEQDTSAMGAVPAANCSEVESVTSGQHEFGEAGTFFVKVEQDGQRDMGTPVRYTIQLKSGDTGIRDK